MIAHPQNLFSALHVAGDFPFSDAVRFTFGGAIHNLWPLLIVPALAGLATDRAAAGLPRSRGAAAAALALAGAPGVLALLLITGSWLGIQPIHTWRGVVLYRLTPAFALALAGFASLRFWGRQVLVARLFRISRPPGPRLAAAAQGLRVRELATAKPECFVAGVLRPTVFVSTGTLALLDEPQLAAALAHERAHVAGGDPFLLAILAVLGDLAPFGGGQARERFLAAREARADHAATLSVGALPLAAALVALARPSGASGAVLPMAGAESLAWRMDALLGEPPASGSAVPLQVWAPLGFLAWPLAQQALLAMFCG